MAKTNRSAFRALPADVKAAIAKGLVGANLEKHGRVRVFPLGIPVEDWIVSVLPNSANDAKKILDQLTRRPGRQYEVFPYGIINPEIGRIDLKLTSGRR